MPESIALTMESGLNPFSCWYGKYLLEARAVLVMMSTRRQPQSSEQASRLGAAGTKQESSAPLRYLFFFRGRRRSEQSAESRPKDSRALEFWFVLAVALALIAIVVLVCLHGVAAFR
jgi:hypothetical protein